MPCLGLQMQHLGIYFLGKYLGVENYIIWVVNVNTNPIWYKGKQVYKSNPSVVELEDYHA